MRKNDKALAVRENMWHGLNELWQLRWNKLFKPRTDIKVPKK